MANTYDNFDGSDDSSIEDDPGQVQNPFESNRASLSDYEANRASLSDYETNNRASFSDYETNNRASLSDFESNRLSLSEQENALSDQESNKDYTEHNDHGNVHLSDSNSEEESKPYYQPDAPAATFYKYGQEPKVVRKKKSPAGVNNSSKRHRSTDSEVSDEGPAPHKRNRYEELARPAQPEPHTSDKAMAMMEKMGYTEGRGLGKHMQGRLAPVELSKQRGRRGLGLRMPGLEPESLVWDSSMEIVDAEEEAKWLVGEHLPALDSVTLQSWKEIGPRNLNIDECNDFCEPDLLTNVLRNKSIFDNLGGDEMRRARARSNPFETIGKGMFLNRAAMKMANLDRVFDFMFTQPKTKTGDHMVKKNELLYFADVCAGPGGFSEYVLWRKQWRAKGFGFTLKGENDFKLSDFFSGPCESFEPYYGVKEDGDVFEPKNIESLMHFVMDHTGQQGVHFMMADGGFSVDGQENIQELLSKQLYLCQFLVALCIVRTGGHFVCKLFDIFSPFSVGLIYLMYRAFERISIHKPNTSRPANSERYIICKWKRDDCEPTRQYMFELNKELCQLGKHSGKDINLCVSMEELTQDTQFFDYIVRSNNELGERQIINLVKIQAYCRDMALTESRQADMRRRCLAYWGVDDVARKLSKTTAEDIEKKRLDRCGTGVLTAEGTLLKNEEDLKNVFKSIFDWYSIPIASQDIHFIIGLGRNKVFRLAQGGKFWKKLEGSGVELSPGTMLYGEIVTEYQGVGRSQVKKVALQIIDAVSLGHEDVSQLFYTERLNLCRLFAESLNKTTRTDLWRLRVKIIFPLEDIHHFFKGLTVIGLKNGTKELMSEIDSVYYQPKGVIFFKTTKDPYRRFISSSTGYCYYHKAPNTSLYDAQRPPDACASTVECIAKRQLWIWTQGAGIHQEPPIKDVLHKDQLIHFISKLKGR